MHQLGVVFFCADRRRTDMTIQVVAIRFKKRLSTFLPVVILLASQLSVVLLPLDVAHFSDVISRKGRETAAVRFNLFWKDRIV